MTFWGETEHFSGKNGALRWRILVGKQKHNVQKPNFDYLYETRVMAAMLRVDRGTETGVMATLHSFLRRHHGDLDPSDSVVYGPSTENQVA